MNIQTYKQSLENAENAINIAKQEKALKDVVGDYYEAHRATLYTEAGFTTVRQQKMGFAIDIAVYDNDDNMLILEETKGHYVDKCFFERALVGFCRTIKILKKANKPIPILLVHSFCKYNQHEKTFQEFCDMFEGASVITELKTHFKYTYIHDRDRKNKKLWFSKNEDRTPYSTFAIDTLIQQDLDFIHSLS